MKILITGGTGFIGEKLVEYFLNMDYEINVLTRNIHNKNSTKNLKFFKWKPKEKKVDFNSIKGVSVIINLSGKNIFSYWSKKNKKEILNSRIDSLITLNKLILKNDKLEHVISASATGIYFNNSSYVQDEFSKTNLESFLGNVVDKWEKELNKLSYKNIYLTKLRIGIVLSKDGGFLKKLIFLNNIRINPLINKGNQWQSWIHIDDLIRSIHFVINNKLNGVINLVSPNPSTNYNINNKVIELNKKPFISFSTPCFVAKIPFRLLGITKFFNEIIMNNQKVFPKKLLESGFVFKFENLKKIMTF